MLSCAKPFSALGGQTAHQGRGAADRDEYREVAGAIAKSMIARFCYTGRNRFRAVIMAQGPIKAIKEIIRLGG